jgi:hypothetical protein
MSLFLFVVVSSALVQTAAPAEMVSDFMGNAILDKPSGSKLPSQSSTRVWHQDCSNTSAFSGLGSTAWTHTSTLEVSFGSVSASGGYIYASDYGSGSDYHGPLYYHTFADSFPIRDLVSLSMEVEIDGTANDRIGKIIVALHDETTMQIAHVEVGDPWAGSSYAFSNCLYQYSNGDDVYTPLTYPDYTSAEPHRGTVTLLQNSSGMFSEIPSGNNEMVIDAASIETGRNVKYISIYITRHASNPATEVLRIHDIEVRWNKANSTTTTTTTVGPLSPMILLAAAGGSGVLLIVAVVYINRRRTPKEKPGTAMEKGAPPPPGTGAVALDVNAPIAEADVKALRGGEFTGNRFRYKVKVVNNSDYVITDTTVTLLSYPRDSLKLDGDVTKIVPKIDPEGFRSPSFGFTPTQDCVKGNIVASVSFVDHKGVAHSLTTQPYTIRAVCDLLTAESITPENFKIKLSSMNHGELIVEVKEWTPEEMGIKTLAILESSNFYEVSMESSKVGEYAETRVTGWAKGKYTGKNVGIEITITGKPEVQGATCKVRMSGEDEAMILPAIDEIKQKLGAWLCPRCSGALPADLVGELKAGRSVACPFCGVTIDR